MPASKKGLATAVTGCETDEDRDPRVKSISFPQEECLSLARRREPIDLRPYQVELLTRPTVSNRT